MTTRKRIKAIIPTVTGGGGGGPAPGGTINWGPDFGEPGGGDDNTHTVNVAQTMDALALEATQNVNVAQTMDRVALQATQNISVSQTGTALGAPFWQSVQTATATASPLVITKPTGVQSGDLLLAFIGVTVTGTAGTPTITPPTGWTSIRQDRVQGGANTTQGNSFYRIADGTEGSSFSFTLTFVLGTSPRITGEVHRIIATHATTPINAHNGATITAASLDPDPDSPSVTTTASNCLVFAFLQHDHLTLSQTHTPAASHQETTDFEAVNTSNRTSSHSMWRVFSATGATGTAEHNCTETAATDAVMQRIALAPGELTLA